MRSRRGFTLMEMMITLAVFVLLSAAIFSIITGVLKSAASLQDNQNREDQIMALQAYLKKSLGSLPAQGKLVSYRRGNGEGLDQNGIIFGPPAFLTAIDGKVQANGLYLLRVATFSSTDQAINASLGLFQREVTDDDASLSWTRLVVDLQHVHWKFEDNNNVPWVDLWTTPNTKPNLVELSVQIAGDLKPSAMDFWIPPIYSAPVILPGVPASGGSVNPPPVNAP